MATVEIFRCDVCRDETRLEENPYTRRHKFTYISDFIDISGSTTSRMDVCKECIAAIQSALNSAIYERTDIGRRYRKEEA